MIIATQKKSKQDNSSTVLDARALTERATLRSLIGHAEDAEPRGEIFDTKIKALAEYIKHHVGEEHNEIFPQAKSTKLNLIALGSQIDAWKAELQNVS